MCYLFKSMKTNRLLNPGDTIALATPIFTPYLEMPHLEDYDLNVVHVQAKQENRFQFDDADKIVLSVECRTPGAGASTCPVGAGRTCRAIGREMSQNSRLTIVHTTRRASRGNFRGGQSTIAE